MKALAAAVLLSSSAAWAWPVDTVYDVPLGKEKFIKLLSLDWVEVEDAKVATAEWMPSGELVVSGLKAGSTLVLLYAEGHFAVWKVRVGSAGRVDEKLAASAEKACPKLQRAAHRLEATVASEACRRALIAWLQTDVFIAAELEITFDGAVLQEQLRSIEPLLPKSAQARYLGAGLVLTGNVTAAEHHRLMWEIFRRSLGRVALDDQLEISPRND